MQGQHKKISDPGKKASLVLIHLWLTCLLNSWKLAEKKHIFSNSYFQTHPDVSPFPISHYSSGIFHKSAVTFRRVKVHLKLKFRIQFYFFLLSKFRLNFCLENYCVCVCVFVCVKEREFNFPWFFTPSLCYFWPSRDREGNFKEKGEMLWTGVKVIWPLLGLLLLCSSSPPGRRPALGMIQKRSRCWFLYWSIPTKPQRAHITPGGLSSAQQRFWYRMLSCDTCSSASSSQWISSSSSWATSTLSLQVWLKRRNKSFLREGEGKSQNIFSHALPSLKTLSNLWIPLSGLSLPPTHGALCGMWDLISAIRDWTHVPDTGNAES